VALGSRAPKLSVQQAPDEGPSVYLPEQELLPAG